MFAPRLETRAEYRTLHLSETVANEISLVHEVIIAKQLNWTCIAISKDLYDSKYSQIIFNRQKKEELFKFLFFL